MKQLIYYSLAHQSTSLETLEAILSCANRNNYHSNINGLLVYNGIYFLQCLEGRAIDVDETFERIRFDHRHREVIVIGSREIIYKDFSDWHMGFVGRSKRMSKEILKLTGKITFNPSKYNYNCAKEVLNTLAHLV